jgi:hypothetical protein
MPLGVLIWVTASAQPLSIPFFVPQNIEMPRRARLCSDRNGAPMCRQREDAAHHCSQEVSYLLYPYMCAAAHQNVPITRWIIRWKTTTTCPSSSYRPQTSRAALRVTSACSTAFGLWSSLPRLLLRTREATVTAVPRRDHEPRPNHRKHSPSPQRHPKSRSRYR